MTNNELTLDQLQSTSGGATAIEYGLIATLLPKDQVTSTECKVPAPDKSLDGYAVVRERERLIGIA